jgi:hypothetical protein
LLQISKDTLHLITKYAGEARSHEDVASTLENSMRRLSFIAAAWASAGEKKIGLSDWVKNGESVLVLGRSPEMESTMQELNRAIVFRMSQLILNLSEAERAHDGRPERQIWVVMDELREVGRLEHFNNLLVAGRSKGACVVVGFQDIPGLQAVYGKELAKELVGVCAHKAFLRTSDLDTQNFASSQLGYREIELPRVSSNHGSFDRMNERENVTLANSGVSLSYQRMQEALVLPSELETLPRPSPATGISGYYKSAAVLNPYFANIPGDEVSRLLPRPAPSNGQIPEKDLDFVPRFDEKDMLSLKEWDEEDLRRLNLQKFPALLETDADKKDWSKLLPNKAEIER